MTQIKKLTISIAVFVCCFMIPVSGNAETINVADFGIFPKTDVTMQVNNLVKSVQNKKGVTLFFPKGEYWFYPENAVEEYRAVSNHENAVRRLAFPLKGLEDFTLDGNGSTFMFFGKISPIVLDNAQNTTLKNFSIDWDTPFHHELEVIETNKEKNSFVAKIRNDKYGYELKNGRIYFNHYNWQDEMAQNIAFDPHTSAPYYDTKRYALRYKGNTSFKRISSTKILFVNATNEVPPVGAILCNYGASTDNRYAQAMHITQSKNTYIENVRIYAAGGMALMAERDENITLNKMVVTATDKRIMSTRADASHFLGCKGTIKMENCLLEQMADDGINVHGAYVKIEKYLGDHVFLCEISHRQQKGLVFAEAGDRLMVVSRETVLPVFETKVKAVKVLNQDRLLITMTEVPDDLPTGPLSLENLSWYPDVVMKHNTIRNNRARAALISTKGKVIIEDNFFSSQMHGILIEGDNKAWYESGGVLNVTINHNTFDNIGYGTLVGYPLYVSPMLTPEQHLGDQKYHQNITFTNNRIKSFNGQLVHARSVKGLVLTGNVIELDDTYPVYEGLPAVDLDYCEGIRIENNTFKNFNWPSTVSAKNRTQNIIEKNNIGLDVRLGMNGLSPSLQKVPTSFKK